MASKVGVEGLQEMLHQSPRQYGQAISRWSLELAAQVAFAQGLTATRLTGEKTGFFAQREREMH